MSAKYHSTATKSQQDAFYAHGPHIAELLFESMAPTQMSPTELFNRYRDERSPRPNEKFTEWALIHFGYISIKNVDNPLAAQKELTERLLVKAIPEYDTADELIEFHEAHPRVDGEATDGDLIRMDADNVAIIGMDSIGVDGIASFCESMAVQTTQAVAA